MSGVEITDQKRRVRRGLGLLAIGGLGLIAWIVGILITTSDANVDGFLGLLAAMVGLVGMLVTAVGVVGGLVLIAMGLLGD